MNTSKQKKKLLKDRHNLLNFSIFNKIKLLETIDQMPINDIADQKSFETIASHVLENSQASMMTGHYTPSRTFSSGRSFGKKT